jgi:hypothetical protein
MMLTEMMAMIKMRKKEKKSSLKGLKERNKGRYFVGVCCNNYEGI